MHRSLQIGVIALLLSVSAVQAQEATSVISEEREAALGYITTTNFLIGRVGRDCLGILGRKESAQDFVRNWQTRNVSYVSASAKYLEIRLNEVLANDGAERRDAVLREMQSTTRANVDGMLQKWFHNDSREKVCQRVVGLVETGRFDVSPSTPVFKELQALVIWAQGRNQ